MTKLDVFLWIIFPYISLTIFVLGHIYRYNTDQFGWTAESSQILEQKRLKWGSILFHYGIILVFFGHVAGLLIPKGWFDAIGINSHLYHFGAVWFGTAAGIATVIGGLLLFLRRVSVRRVLRNSTKGDFVTLILLGVVVLVGFSATLGYTVSGGDFDYRVVLGPWIREILTFNLSEGMVLAMASAPIGFRLHVLLAFVLFAAWPFTRLVHVFSFPLKYLRRRYIPYRNMKRPGKVELPNKNEIH